MLLIECPWCGPRAEAEFTCGGEAEIARPLETEKLTDKEWGDYLFMRHNARGVHKEQWLHAQGCRRWFMATRDTVTYQIHGYEKFRTGGAVNTNDSQNTNQSNTGTQGSKA
jgi:sarcosine oxidase subunit delta